MTSGSAQRMTMAAAAGLLAAGLASGPAAAQVQDRIDRQSMEVTPPADFQSEGAAGGGASATDPRADALVDDPQKDPVTGQVEAETGAAKPVESWLGCKPSAEGQSEPCDEPGTAASN